MLQHFFKQPKHTKLYVYRVNHVFQYWVSKLFSWLLNIALASKKASKLFLSFLLLDLTISGSRLSNAGWRLSLMLKSFYGYQIIRNPKFEQFGQPQFQPLGCIWPHWVRYAVGKQPNRQKEMKWVFCWKTIISH